MAGATLTPRVTLSYLGRQLASLFGDVPADVIPAHTLIDVQLRYQAKRGLSVEGYVKNLANRTYIAGKFEDLQYYGAPRQFGVRLGWRF